MNVWMVGWIKEMHSGKTWAKLNTFGVSHRSHRICMQKIILTLWKFVLLIQYLQHCFKFPGHSIKTAIIRSHHNAVVRPETALVSSGRTFSDLRSFCSQPFQINWHYTVYFLIMWHWCRNLLLKEVFMLTCWASVSEWVSCECGSVAQWLALLPLSKKGQGSSCVEFYRA